MIARVTLATVWMALGSYMYVYYLALGKAVGGTQYLVHVGQGGATAVILSIGAGCLVMGVLTLIRPSYARGWATAMLILSAIFLVAQWLPLPIPTGIGTYVRPLGFAGEYALFLYPIAAFVTRTYAKNGIDRTASKDV